MLIFFFVSHSAVSGCIAVSVFPTVAVAACLLVFVLVGNEKVPFDLVEAESELIDGITVDLPGSVFSMVYAAESMLVWVSAKMFLPADFGFLWISLSLLLIAFFTGRVFVSRFLLADFENFILATGLSLSLFAVSFETLVGQVKSLLDVPGGRIFANSGRPARVA